MLESRTVAQGDRTSVEHDFGLTSQGIERIKDADLYHWQVSAHPGWGEHAHLLGCPRACGARTRGPRRHQRQGGARAVSYAYARGGLAALRGKLWRRLGHGSLDRSGRPLSGLYSDGEPFCIEACRYYSAAQL